ncbi:ABC transporter ATP-binding protein [Paenibacillus sp. FSL R7-0333]|uniref:ABC transporter ATP-binding protein n=1 Tax=Paenibacillus sp. FSL R7-0333 TaxID=1926587 RepID=UPI00096F505E|nr:hypothetical protein BK146_24895 [Paenibacillus sp. FSL R7-0333]
MNNILKIEHLTKSYPSFLLDNINFQLKEGTITGFVGANGAGKTTTLHSILNIINYNSGSVLFKGEQLTKERNDLKTSIGYMGSYNKFYENVKLKVISKFVSEVYKNTWDKQYYQYLVTELFELDTNKKIKELSKGMQAKFSLSLALSHHPDLLILDEPTSGLDPFARDALLDILYDLNKDKNTTILFSSHITEDIEKIAHDVIFIDNGKLLLQASKEQLRATYKKAEVSKIQGNIINQPHIRNKDFLIFERDTALNLPESSLENARIDDVLQFLKMTNCKSSLTEGGHVSVVSD